MPYIRRKPYATSFKWPPTREDLDLIEVVDAGTLSPVHARCDEPEPQPPEPPVLLKSVVPVRPVVRPEYDLLPALREPQPLVVIPPPAPTPTHAGWAHRLTAHIDPNWLIASGAALAVSLSAWMSLRATPTVSASDLDTTPVVASRPTTAPLNVPRFTPFTLGWSLGINAPGVQPPATSSMARAAKADRTPASTRNGRLLVAPQTAAHDATARLHEASEGPTLAAARLAQPASQPQPQRAALKPLPAPPPALNTRRSPFLSNVIASMPAAPAATVPTIRPAVETHADHAAPTRPAGLTESKSANATPTTPFTAPEHTRSAAPAVRQGDAAESTVARNEVVPPPAAEHARSAAMNVGAPVQASQQQVRAALKEYERAYEQLDAKAVRAVWPSVDTRALERAFHDLKSQTLVFDRCDIDVARGSQAVAACSGRATYETRAGQQAARSEPREWTFTLQKSDEAWRIVSASAR